MWTPELAEHLARIVDSAPALRAHAALLRARHADALGAALADAFAVPHDDLACTALARFVLEITVVDRTHRPPGRRGAALRPPGPGLAAPARRGRRPGRTERAGTELGGRLVQ